MRGSQCCLLFGLATSLAVLLTGHRGVDGPAADGWITASPGGVYRLDIRDGTGRLELTGRRDRRHLLVLTPLGPSDRQFRIRLDARPLGITSGGETRVAGSRFVPPPSASGSEIRSRWRDDADDAPSATMQLTVSVHRPGPATMRDFFLHVSSGPLGDAAGYMRISSELVAEGRWSRVFVDRDESLAAKNRLLAAEVAWLLDNEIIPSLEPRIGRHRDLDGDGKLGILLTGWLGRLQGGRTSLGGMVRSNDFRNDVDPPFGNRGDLLYLNTNLAPGPRLRDILTHEYTHAICFSRRRRPDLGSKPLPEEEDWLNESLAHVSEPGWSNIEQRVSRFLETPSRFPLVVSDYYRSGRWRCHGCRGAAYLFLRWCIDRFGHDLPARLIAGPDTGRANLESATGRDFSELVRGWSISLLSLRPDCGELRPAGRFGDDMLPPSSQRGPQSRTWDITDRPTNSVTLVGTAVCIIELSGVDRAATGRPTAIRITGSRSSQLQATLVVLSNPAQATSDDSPGTSLARRTAP